MEGGNDDALWTKRGMERRRGVGIVGRPFILWDGIRCQKRSIEIHFVERVTYADYKLEDQILSTLSNSCWGLFIIFPNSTYCVRHSALDRRTSSTCLAVRLVGSTIQYDQRRLQAWLGEAHPHARVIVVYGMWGVGKMSLLRAVYNNKEVSGVLDVVKET
jgi:hypothetical protein